MLKKLLILGLAIMLTGPAYAACDYAAQCAAPYDMSSKVTQVLCNATGSTFFAEMIAKSILKKELKKATKEKFNVKLDSFSAKDLSQGRFKSMTISGKDLEIEGIYLSKLDVKTLCDFNYIEIGRNTIKFKENMVLGYHTEITDLDLTRTMESSEYKKMLNSLNLSGLGISFLKVQGMEMRVKNNKIYFVMKIASPLMLGNKPFELKMNTDFKVENGRIVFTKVDMENLYTRIDLSKITYLLNILNPLDFSLDIIDNANAKMQVQNVNIIGDKILIDGVVFIPKNVTAKGK